MKEKILSVLTDVKASITEIFADKKKKRSLIIYCSVAAVVIATVIAVAVYAGDFYSADRSAIDQAMANISDIEIYDLRGGVTVYEPKDKSDVGFIFYPGGKVDHNAYTPLVAELASRGITTVICEMPLKLAVLNVNAADVIPDALPEVEHWYIGGHSLGGSMAATYLDSHPEISGLILLGSYSTADVSDKRALSIYGSEDGVMNREKYEQYKSNLSFDMTELVIEGGNHAYFGMYGEQDGDGRATISPAEQIEITADAIAEFINH